MSIAAKTESSTPDILPDALYASVVAQTDHTWMSMESPPYGDGGGLSGDLTRQLSQPDFNGKINQLVDYFSGDAYLNHMVERSSAHLDAVFHALSDATRRAMLSELSSGPRSIGELAAPFSMTFAGASKHVKVLESAGLVRRKVLGRMHICQLDAARLSEAEAWLRHYERFWTTKLDKLEELLLADDDQRKSGKGSAK